MWTKKIADKPLTVAQLNAMATKLNDDIVDFAITIAHDARDNGGLDAGRVSEMVVYAFGKMANDEFSYHIHNSQIGRPKQKLPETLEELKKSLDFMFNKSAYAIEQYMSEGQEKEYFTKNSSKISDQYRELGDRFLRNLDRDIDIKALGSS